MVETGSDVPLMRPELLLGGAGAGVAVPRDVVVVVDSSHVQGRGRRQTGPFRKIVERKGAAIVQAVGPGAPTCAVTLEFLASLGARRVVMAGVAGSFDPTISIGTVGVIAGAESDEGTSARYGGHRDPCPDLTGSLAQVGTPVRCLTTDTPMRLTQADVDAFSARCDVVEMEAAALFAAGQALGVATAAIVSVSDTYDETGWHLGDRSLANKALGSAIESVLDVFEATR